MKPIFSRAMTPPRPSGARVEFPRISGRGERSSRKRVGDRGDDVVEVRDVVVGAIDRDRKSTRLNSSHVAISYAVFCLKKKKNDEWVSRGEPGKLVQIVTSREE